MILTREWHLNELKDRQEVAYGSTSQGAVAAPQAGSLFKERLAGSLNMGSLYALCFSTDGRKAS